VFNIFNGVFIATEKTKKFMQKMPDIPIEGRRIILCICWILALIVCLTQNLWLTYAFVGASFLELLLSIYDIVRSSVYSLRNHLKMFLILLLISGGLYAMLYLVFKIQINISSVDFSNPFAVFYLFSNYYIFSGVFMLVWVFFNLVVESKVAGMVNDIFSTLLTVFTVIINLIFLSMPNNYMFNLEDGDSYYVIFQEHGWTVVKLFQSVVNGFLLPLVITFTITSFAVKLKTYWRGKYYVAKNEFSKELK